MHLKGAKVEVILEILFTQLMVISASLFAVGFSMPKSDRTK